MAVLAGIVPAHAVVGKGAALDAHSEREQRKNSGDSESGRHGKRVLRQGWLN